MFRKQHGFTLIELMVTLVVLGIVIGVALPSFKSQILSNKAGALSEDLLEALNFARSEAIKQARPAQAGATARFITLCASANGTACSSNTSGWGDGFIVLVDYATTEATSPPVASIDAARPLTILRVWSKQDPKAAISVKHGANAGTPTSFIRYTSSGKLAARTVPASGVRILTKMKDKTDTDCLPNSARQIDIGVVGMVRVAKEKPDYCW